MFPVLSTLFKNFFKKNFQKPFFLVFHKEKAAKKWLRYAILCCFPTCFSKQDSKFFLAHMHLHIPQTDRFARLILHGSQQIIDKLLCSTSGNSAVA